MTPTTLVQSGGVPEVRIAERQHLNCMDIGAVGATGLPQSGNGSDELAKLATPATPEVQSRQAQCVDSCALFVELGNTQDSSSCNPNGVKILSWNMNGARAD